MTTPFADYILIPLTQGKFAKVSWSRIDDVVGFRWFANRDGSTGRFYAMRGVKINGKWNVIKMHRQLLGLVHGDPRQGDHINHDGLDNRDENLRIATRRQNVHNRRRQKSNKTGYIGVSVLPGGKVRASISHHGIKIDLGCFPANEAIAAARRYDEEARKLFGEFAYLNFPSK